MELHVFLPHVGGIVPWGQAHWKPKLAVGLQATSLTHGFGRHGLVSETVFLLCHKGYEPSIEKNALMTKLPCNKTLQTHHSWVR